MSEDELKLLDAVRTAIMAKYDYSRPWFNDGISAALDAVDAVELAGRPARQDDGSDSVTACGLTRKELHENLARLDSETPETTIEAWLRNAEALKEICMCGEPFSAHSQLANHMFTPAN